MRLLYISPTLHGYIFAILGSMDSDTVSKITAIKLWLGTGSINIFGIQLSGKDTQGHLLADSLGAPLVGGGEVLRSSLIPESAREALRQGKYIDSKEYLDIMVPYFSRVEYKNRPLILSSVGRRSGEEQSVIAALVQAGHPIKAVVVLELDEAEAFRRLEKSDRGRQDDHHENLASRINEFKAKTLPVIDAYKQLGLLLVVDGSKPREVVFKDIIDELYKFAI